METEPEVEDYDEEEEDAEKKTGEDTEESGLDDFGEPPLSDTERVPGL